ncbi:hypothetical protein H0H93_014897 [Arthromyces matolae]|nr:hypothetical protein H0H93_014897 [Arthromyces matolae]
MIFSSAFLPRATVCSRRVKFVRAFSVALPIIPAKTKTTKSFVDLPSVYLKPDGSVAEPLEEWTSGPNKSASESTSLNASSSAPLRRSRKKKSSVESEDSLSSGPNSLTLPKVKTRSRTIKKSLSSVVEGEKLTSDFICTPPCNDEAASFKRAKKKSKKAASFERLNDTHSTVASTGMALLQLWKSTQPLLVDKGTQPQTALAQEILENLRRFPHCLLLTRVGQFYESYFDQATEIARLLSIKLTTRKWGNGRVPMCGFPLAHLDKHLKVLVQQHKRFVAMCEEFPRYSDGIKSFERRVTRVVTPGTLIDEPFLNPFENNFLLAIGSPNVVETVSNDDRIGIAWIDVSTGEFFSRSTSLDGLRDDLSRIAPREVVLDNLLQQARDHPIYEALAEDDNFVSYITPSFLPESGPFPLASAEAGSYAREHDIEIFGPTVEETAAINILTTYLHANLLEHMPALSSPNREAGDERMQIDSHTIKALEIRERIREGGAKGSLLSVIKRTLTSGGTRLLTRWLCRRPPFPLHLKTLKQLAGSPSTSISEINARQSLVAFFHARPHFHADLAEALAQAEDTTRIVQKFSLGRGETTDLLGIKRTARVWTALMKRIMHEKSMESNERPTFDNDDWASLDALISKMINLDNLSQRIGAALEDRTSDEAPRSIASNATSDEGGETFEPQGEENLPSDTDLQWKYGGFKWTIKPRFERAISKDDKLNFSPALGVLHDSLQKLLPEREKMERELQLKHAHGMHVHLAKAKRDQRHIITDPDFVSIAESYDVQDWSRLASKIGETTLALAQAEKEAFQSLREEVNSYSRPLRHNARLWDELDVALSFATLASELNFVRPQMTEDPIYEVTNGRHPTVELGLLSAGRVFTPNSVTLMPESRLHVITGPNMAGKSTFLRQTALMSILAQTGSFVPADSAVMGIVDKLFSRIGAKDDLFHDRSTFMVEMLETAEILRRATPRSLVIMDEVGRGTTVTDGLAISYATLHHLVHTNQCRALFATHFHELSDMVGYPNQHRTRFQSVDFFCTDVDEADDTHFAYQYRVRPGVNRDSHGLKVAHLAGMPTAALDIATNTLAILKARDEENRRLDAKILHHLRE